MKIVVLDASITVRKKIQNLLLDIDSVNLDIELFEDANDALFFIKENGADMIFSSIETMGLDGISFADIVLGEFPQYVSTLFVVTSQNNTEALEDMKNVGVKRFIKKPINEEHFKHFMIPEIKKYIR